MTQATESPSRLCPRCRRRDTRRSQRSLLERLLGFLRLRPYRCLLCHARFWSLG